MAAPETNLALFMAVLAVVAVGAVKVIENERFFFYCTGSCDLICLFGVGGALARNRYFCLNSCLETIIDYFV